MGARDGGLDMMLGRRHRRCHRARRLPPQRADLHPSCSRATAFEDHFVGRVNIVQMAHVLVLARFPGRLSCSKCFGLTAPPTRWPGARAGGVEGA